MEQGPPERVLACTVEASDARILFHDADAYDTFHKQLRRTHEIQSILARQCTAFGDWPKAALFCNMHNLPTAAHSSQLSSPHPLPRGPSQLSSPLPLPRASHLAVVYIPVATTAGRNLEAVSTALGTNLLGGFMAQTSANAATSTCTMT